MSDEGFTADNPSRFPAPYCLYSASYENPLIQTSTFCPNWRRSYPTFRHTGAAILIAIPQENHCSQLFQRNSPLPNGTLSVRGPPNPQTRQPTATRCPSKAQLPTKPSSVQRLSKAKTMVCPTITKVEFDESRPQEPEQPPRYTPSDSSLSPKTQGPQKPSVFPSTMTPPIDRYTFVQVTR